MDAWMDAWMDGWMEEWIDEWMTEVVNGWMDDGRSYIHHVPGIKQLPLFAITAPISVLLQLENFRLLTNVPSVAVGYII